MSQTMPTFPERVRFNWAFHDGTLDAQAGRNRDLSNHYDPLYVAAYRYGQQSFAQLQMRAETSDEAWALYENRYKKPVLDFSVVTEEAIVEAINNSDIDDALFKIQKAIGIDSGDVAGMFFSGGLADEWPKATPERRREILAKYLQTEENLYLNDDTDEEEDCPFDADTRALLADLRVLHGALEPQVVYKDETALVDDESARDELVAVVVNGMVIHDLFMSSCGRFEVKPEETYGVSLATALRIKAHNRT